MTHTSFSRRLVERCARLPRPFKVVLIPFIAIGIAVWIALFHNRAEFWED